MKKQYLLSLTALIWSYCLFSQSPYSTTFHDNIGVKGIAAIAHGNKMLIAGKLSDFNGLLCLFNDTAGLMWSKRYQESNVNFTGLCSRPGAFIAACGYVLRTGSSWDGFVIKLKENGDTIWCRKLVFPGYIMVEPKSIATSPDSALIVGGRMTDASLSQNNGFVVKISSSGQQVWSRVLSALPDIVNVASVKVHTDSTVFAVASKVTGAQQSEVFITRLSPSGTQLQSYSAGAGTAKDLQLEDTSLVVYVERTHPILFRSSLSGSVMAAKEYTIGSGPSAEAKRLCRVSAGGYVLSATADGHYVVKTDGNLFATSGHVTYLRGSDVFCTDGGQWAMGNGPTYGVRTSGIVDPQICLTQLPRCASFSNPPTRTVTVNLTAKSLTAAVVGTLSMMPLPSGTVSLFNRTGCADHLGGMNDLGRSDLYRAWPVPVNDKLHLELEVLLPGGIQVSLVDMAGMSVFSVENAAANDLEIDCSSLPPGIYILRLRGEGYSGTRKVVIMH